MIVTILLNALVISLFTTAIYIATDDNMILNGFKNWADKWTSYEVKDELDIKEVRHLKVYNWIIGCPYCMPSFHGIYLFTFLNWNEINSPIWILYYIIAFTCATGLNSITVSMYNK